MYFFYATSILSAPSLHLLDLPFDDILSCAATCRSMLHDVMPLIKTLRIDKATQMNIIVACRFVGVKALHINSLLTLRIEDEDTEDEIREIGVHFETKVRVIPFCSKFSKLEQLFFGGKTENGDDIQGFFPGGDEFWAGEDPYPDEGEREMLMALLDELSGAFCCKALPPQLKFISGLCCPESRNHICKWNVELWSMY